MGCCSGRSWPLARWTCRHPRRRRCCRRCPRRSEEHTSELQSPCNLVCRLLLEKKKTIQLILRMLMHYVILCIHFVSRFFAFEMGPRLTTRLICSRLLTQNSVTLFMSRTMVVLH